MSERSNQCFHGHHEDCPPPCQCECHGKQAERERLADRAYAACMRSLTPEEAALWNKHSYNVRWKWWEILTLTLSSAPESFQWRVRPWILRCFGPEIAGDRAERNHRFLEESLELAQSLGCSKADALELVDYVYGRPVGEPAQETGGVMVTLAALCLANGLSLHTCAEVELSRIWGKIDTIRAKQAAKPKGARP